MLWRVFSTEDHVEHTVSTEKAHLQCRKRFTMQISYIVGMDEGVQYRATKTAQGVIGGFIYLEK